MPTASRASIYASRIFPRRPLDVRVCLTVLSNSGERVWIYGRTSDLSLNGAGLTLPQTLAHGVEVAIRFRLPNREEALVMHAVVTRRQGSRVGIRFLQASAEQRLMLAEFCRA